MSALAQPAATGQLQHDERLDEIELARARLYELLAQILAKPPNRELLRQVSGLRGDDSPLGQGLSELGRVAGMVGEDEAEREFHALFIGVERGELVPYASYYRTGFLLDRPLAHLRQDMQALGIERAPGVAEPEDHIAALLEMMAGLITGAFDADAVGEQEFFRRHLAPWAGRFFDDLERATSARLYRPVGTIGRLFLEIESTAWAMTEANDEPGRASPTRANREGRGQ